MVRALTKEEFTILTNNVDKFSHLGKYMRLAVATGLRVSGCISVKMEDLYDFANHRAMSSLYVRKHQLKGGKKQGSTVAALTIKLPTWFKGYIEEYVKYIDDAIADEACKFIIPALNKTTKFITVTDERIRQLLTEAILKYLADASGERISTHSFRKLYAVTAYECSEKNLPAVQAMLGHKSISSTGHYPKETIHKISEVSDSVGESMAQIMG